MKKIYHLGIIGTGRIAHRFVPEARTIKEIEVTAVYNPRLSSAEKFAEDLQIECATNDMEVFTQKVDAVYIATPHETHVEYCRQMLQAEKHVLCEKPLSFSKKEAQELFQLAEEKECILMEGLKTAYCPGFQALIKVAKSGKIGQIVDVEACFSRIQQSNVREMWDEEYGGSFTEFGTYPLLPIVKLLGTNDKYSNIWTLQGKNGVDMYTKTTFDYGSQTALVKTGLAVKSEGQLVIAGTKGYILVPSPWWLTKYFEVRYEDPNKIEKYQFPFERQGLHYEVKEFVRQMRELSVTADEELVTSKEKEISKYDLVKEEKTDISSVLINKTICSTANNYISGLTAEESIWFASKMEEYLENRKERLLESTKVYQKDDKKLISQNIENVDISKRIINSNNLLNMTNDKFSKQNNAKESNLDIEVTHDIHKKLQDENKIGIWAHRGCSFAYPENTLSAFRAAAKLNGITGIELDVQRTKDHVLVVIHDETVDRTTNGSGNVCEHTLAELKDLEIQGKDNTIERIPTMEEVLELLQPYCVEKNLLINIELKNSNIRYEGMEEQLLALVDKYGLEKHIIYSSFLPESMRLLKELNPAVKTGILGIDMAWCYEKAIEMNADAIHPWVGGMEMCDIKPSKSISSENCKNKDIRNIENKRKNENKQSFGTDVSQNAMESVVQEGYPVRVWNGEEPFFGQDRILREKNMTKYGRLGATDVITNVPEIYLL